ncbi:hypothetical protein ElyMa_005445100 [Elysia marginata]|uniref:Ig-like domain-containing protein n=1 Tax=Elysia marginata TaxID=1093978 RepID=A0AAV4EMS2_9GAST|nr:hypothetical protein ElyMa_005445100 [Elysia marginata]
MSMNLTVQYTSTPAVAVLGTGAMLTCSWLPGENEKPMDLVLHTGIENTLDNRIYYQDLEQVNHIEFGKHFDFMRMETLVRHPVTRYVTLLIKDLRMEDHNNITCCLAYRKTSESLPTEHVEKATVSLDVRLSPPEITPIPDYAPVEGLPFYVECEAYVGSTEKGSLIFEIFHAGMDWETVYPVDDRVVFQKAVSDNVAHTVRYRSALNLTLTREDNGLYVTCTVANSEYAPKHHILKACDENILCTKSEKFTILYPVSNDSIRIETAEGGDELVCHAPVPHADDALMLDTTDGNASAGLYVVATLIGSAVIIAAIFLAVVAIKQLSKDAPLTAGHVQSRFRGIFFKEL